MRSRLLLLGVAVALGFGTTAHAQYIYIDVNGDGVCTTSDVLYSALTSVDVWLDTNHDHSGGTVVCSDGTNPLDIGSYDILIHSSGAGGVSYGTWTNNMSGYAQLNPPTTAGPDFGVGYASAGSYDPPGRYKLGTLAVTITGNPSMNFLPTPPQGIPSPVTGFGSECSGSDFPNTISLGVDFFDNCGPMITDAVETTTWGKIKMTYR